MVKNPLTDIFVSSPIRPLQKHMESVHETVTQLPEFLSASQGGDWKLASELHKEVVSGERKADKLKTAVRTHLPKRLFLPVSRSDLLELVTIQDRLANRTQDTVGLIIGRKIRFPDSLWPKLQELTDAVVTTSATALSAVETLDDVIEAGFGSREIGRVELILKDIDRHEKRTDKLQVKLRAALFKIEAELPPVEVMFLYKIIELLGDIADYAEQTGNRLQILIST